MTIRDWIPFIALGLFLGTLIVVLAAMGFNRLDRLECKIDRIEASFDRIEASFDRIDGSMDRLEDAVGRLEEKVLALLDVMPRRSLATRRGETPAGGVRDAGRGPGPSLRSSPSAPA